jgi:hypothetical protein
VRLNRPLSSHGLAAACSAVARSVPPPVSPRSPPLLPVPLALRRCSACHENRTPPLRRSKPGGRWPQAAIRSIPWTSAWLHGGPLFPCHDSHRTPAILPDVRVRTAKVRAENGTASQGGALGGRVSTPSHSVTVTRAAGESLSEGQQLLTCLRSGVRTPSSEVRGVKRGLVPPTSHILSPVGFKKGRNRG